MFLGQFQIPPPLSIVKNHSAALIFMKFRNPAAGLKLYTVMEEDDDEIEAESAAGF
jgi:hypothetical protein